MQNLKALTVYRIRSIVAVKALRCKPVEDLRMVEFNLKLVSSWLTKMFDGFFTQGFLAYTLQDIIYYISKSPLNQSRFHQDAALYIV